jgi:coenzyme F420-reducing hydrogenase delta subunit
LITGCRENDCYHRLGVLWAGRRLNAEREPRLRSRAERDRIRQFWASSADFGELVMELESFRTSLRGRVETENRSG